MERAKLIAARADKHWTLEEAAEHLQVEANTLWRWERGKATPRTYNLRQLCKVYGAAASDLGFGSACPETHAEEADSEQKQVIEVRSQHESATEEVGTAAAEKDSVATLLEQDLTLRLIKLVWTWPIHNTRYHELQGLIMQATEEYSTLNQDNDQLITRRDALRRLALLPIELCGLSALGPVLKLPVEEILTQCAAGITACWYLRKGKELALASSAVSSYLPTLKAIAKSSPTTQRTAAAELLVQCFLLKATLTTHVDGSKDAIGYVQKAEMYSRVAGSAQLQALALRTLAATHYYANDWKSSLETAEQARAILEHTNTPIHKLVHSFVYAGLATYQAYNGQKQDALHSLEMAHTTFHKQPENESALIWIDHNPANLWLNDGMAHFHLGLQKEAITSFSKIESLQQDELGRIEILIDEVMAEVYRDDQPRGMEWCIERWVRGIEGAKALQSEQRFNEAIVAYAAMRAAWPGEKRIRDLREFTGHWKQEKESNESFDKG